MKMKCGLILLLILTRVEREEWCIPFSENQTNGVDGTTGTENLFAFIKSAEVAHGRKTLTHMRVPQGGVPRGHLVQHKHDFMKHQTYFNPTKTPGLANDIRDVSNGTGAPHRQRG